MTRLQKLGAFAILALVIGVAPADAQDNASDSAKVSAPTASSQGGKDAKKNRFAPLADPAPSWAPPDVDAAIPPVDPSAQCPLPTVLKGAADRVQELVESLPKFTATERMEHYEADSSGEWRKPQTVTFEYLVEMAQPRAGMLVMDETRDGSSSLLRFPARLATLGLPALALVFHPYFSGEYEMTCEGLGNWDGQYAWQVHFQQRPDKLPRLRAYRTKDRTYPIKLKGRAWISADNFQVLHIDTDLVDPIPQVELLREHISVEYGPVHFRKEDEDLWLQQSAEVFMDVRGHHFRRRHTFTDFLLFSVQTGVQVKLPKEQ